MASATLWKIWVPVSALRMPCLVRWCLILCMAHRTAGALGEGLEPELTPLFAPGVAEFKKSAPRKIQVNSSTGCGFLKVAELADKPLPSSVFGRQYRTG